MGEVVNLRQARKARAREDKVSAAEENRARHGRTKAEKQLDRLSTEKTNAFLNGHKRATPTSPSRGEVAPQGGASGGGDAVPVHDKNKLRDR